MADFEDFYREQVTPAVRLAFLLCGDRSVAEDVAADALARVCRRWRRARLADPGAYLRRAVVNEIRSRGRRKILERREREWRVVSATAVG